MLQLYPKRGWKGRITKTELRQKLLNLKEGKYVAGYIIKGSDIIKIIEETDLDIKIRNSVIEGGLDFTKLPIVKEKREVNNHIELRDSAIGFWGFERPFASRERTEYRIPSVLVRRNRCTE